LYYCTVYDDVRLLQEEDSLEKGIYHTLKDVMKERDEHGKQWFTKENTSALLMNLVAAGM
jgi:hypothetical protein